MNKLIKITFSILMITGLIFTMSCGNSKQNKISEVEVDKYSFWDIMFGYYGYGFSGDPKFYEYDSIIEQAETVFSFSVSEELYGLIKVNCPETNDTCYLVVKEESDTWQSYAVIHINCFYDDESIRDLSYKDAVNLESTYDYPSMTSYEMFINSSNKKYILEQTDATAHVCLFTNTGSIYVFFPNRQSGILCQNVLLTRCVEAVRYYEENAN